MQIDRISYKKVYPISSYCTEHIGLEASLTEGDNPETELNHLKIMVETLHSATIATLEEFRGTKVRDVVEEPVYSIKGALEEIDKCTEMDGEKGLNSLWLMSKGNLTLSAAWKQKEKQIKG